jgi:hypothetical protein
VNKILHHARLLLILFLITGLFSCERLSELYRLSDTAGESVVKENNETGGENSENPCGEPVVIRLVSTANLSDSPGKVIVTNDSEFITVKFEVTEGAWRFDMIYLHVGPLDSVPLAGGGTYPAFWDFDYQYADMAIDSYTFQVPLADLHDCVNILAQVRFTNGTNNGVTWSEGINPDWTDRSTPIIV